METYYLLIQIKRDKYMSLQEFIWEVNHGLKKKIICVFYPVKMYAIALDKEMTKVYLLVIIEKYF